RLRFGHLLVELHVRDDRLAAVAGNDAVRVYARLGSVGAHHASTVEYGPQPLVLSDPLGQPDQGQVPLDPEAAEERGTRAEVQRQPPPGLVVLRRAHVRAEVLRRYEL